VEENPSEENNETLNRRIERENRKRRGAMALRKTDTGQFKGTGALEAIKAAQTLSELASRYEIHPNQVTRWKNHLVRHVGELFEDR
jgi:transposase